MKKGNLLKLFGVISVLFLMLQLILYKTVYRQTVDFSKPSFKVSHTEKLRLLKIFLTKASELNINIFLIEPDILLSIATNKTSGHMTCSYLCQSSNVITFGIHGNKEQESYLLDDFIADGFLVIESYVKKSLSLPSHLTSNQNLPSHYFLFQTGLILHVVVYYTRGDNFVWSSRVLFEPGVKPPWLKINKLTFGKHSAATFNSIETEVIKIDNVQISVPTNINNFLSDVETSTFIECNYDRAELFYKKNPKDSSPSSLHFQKKGRQLLAKAKDILDSMGIRFWLSSGTCLGWYRQCNIIPYSKDVDIGIWIKDYKEGLTEYFEDHGLLLKHQFGQKNDSFELSFRLGEVKLDIFFFYEEDDHMWNGGTHAWTGQKYKYIFPKFTLCWTELLDLKVRVPCETKSYIVANYGPNWFVPIQDWKWNKSPPNVKDNGMWPTKDWERVIQVYD
ncbi:ribitol-5-phosphate transferase FKTN isoform X1 [Patella vulgata]|uniref:ribitol-5-phosphate transferase FKTN isoform X1 n=2 Tax=Patella vulgata TaxID=6465 RepID=UPI00217FC7B4|nr:ribitol-5-phosphate transferase FKTN isoform X1 [Patella vulgata]